MKTFELTYKNEDGSERYDFYYGSESDTVDSLTKHYASVIRSAKEGKRPVWAPSYYESMSNVKEVIVEQA